MDMEKIAELQDAIANSSKTTKIYVGSDSQRSRNGKVRFATVAILHIDGKHGGKMFSFIDTEMDYNKPNNPRMRLVQEAYKAVDVANAITNVIGDRHLEIHLDLNTDPKHKSHVALKEACGFVFGMTGREAVVKPHSWAASTAADRLTK